MRIKNIEYIEEQEDVYDMEVEKHHNFCIQPHNSDNIAVVHNCLSGETLIPLYNGEIIKLKNLEGKSNFKVFSYDIENDYLRAGNVKRVVLTKKNSIVWKIVFDDKSEIICTSDHKMLMKNNVYKQVKDLSIGDVIKEKYIEKYSKGLRNITIPCGSCHKISNIIKQFRKEDVYDMEVEKYHNFAILDKFDPTVRFQKYLRTVIVHNCCMDEADFSSKKNAISDDSRIKLFNENTRRITSRFKNEMINIKQVYIALVSSVTNEKGFINQYIIKNVDNPAVKVAKFKQWDIKTDNPQNPYWKGFFYCQTGAGNRKARLFVSDEEKKEVEDPNYKIPNSCMLEKVPINFLPDFRNDVDRAIQELLGIAVTTQVGIVETLEPCINKDMNTYFQIDCSNAALPILQQLDQSLFTKVTENKWIFNRCPNALRYSHLDLASKGMACLSICHKEKIQDKTTKEFVNYDVIDLLLAITSSEGSIDPNKITEFFMDLKLRDVFNFYTITADQYNSLFFFNFLKTHKIGKEVKHLSVEGTEKYGLAAAKINSKQVIMGEAPLFQRQIEAIYFEDGKIMIDPNIPYHRDLCDGYVGSIWNAEQNVNDVGIIYENNKDEKKIDFDDLIEI